MRRFALLALASFVGFAPISCGKGQGAKPQQGEEPTSTVATESAVTTTDRPSQLTSHRFYSPALGVEKDYWVYLPAGYDASKQYPTLYLLHGLGGNETNMSGMQVDKLADSVGLEAIIVIPDGDDSFYVNAVETPPYEECMQGTRSFGDGDMESYCVKVANYEDYLVKDLRAEVEEKFHAIDSAAKRAIGGISMGGFGALNLAMRHPEVYSAAISHSGVTSLLFKGVEKGSPTWSTPEEVGYRLGRLGEHLLLLLGRDLENWKANDPALLVEKLEPGPLSIYLDCGKQDEFKLEPSTTYLHERLVARGVKSEYHLLDGRHDSQFWMARFPHSLEFAKRHFAETGAEKSVP